MDSERRRWFTGAAILALALSVGRADAEEPAAAVPGVVAESETRDRAGPQSRIQAGIQTAERWIETGQPEKGLALLRDLLPAAEAEGTDTTPIRFLTAQALMRLRRHDAAVIVLAELVSEQPAVDRFALDYAATLFALGRDEDAGAVFRNMKSERDLPPSVRRNVERFLEQIRARQALRIDLDLGLWHDANVNNAPERETVDVPVFGRILTFTLNEQPVSAWVARTGLRARWRKPIDENRRFSVVTLGSVARNTALGASEHNRTWARASFGPRLRYSVALAGRPRFGMVLADLGAERRFRDGEGYATSLWTGFGARQPIADDWNAEAYSRLWTTHYDGHDGDSDPVGRSLDVRLSHGIGPGWLTVGGKFSREKSTIRHQRWTSRTATVAYAANIGKGLKLSLRANLAQTDFDHEHPVFRIPREDRILGAGLHVSHRSLSWRGYLPELSLSWRRTTSNLPLFERKLLTLQVGLRRLF